MYTLRCPECSELMHRVKQPTGKTIEVGLTQLAYHMFREHTLGQLEEMLTYTAGLIASGKTDVEGLKRVTSLNCPNCQVEVKTDSFLYVRTNKRTRLCCSQACLDAVTK